MWPEAEEAELFPLHHHHRLGWKLWHTSIGCQIQSYLRHSSLLFCLWTRLLYNLQAVLMWSQWRNVEWIFFFFFFISLWLCSWSSRCVPHHTAVSLNDKVQRFFCSAYCLSLKYFNVFVSLFYLDTSGDKIFFLFNKFHENTKTNNEFILLTTIFCVELKTDTAYSSVPQSFIVVQKLLKTH